MKTHLFVLPLLIGGSAAFAVGFQPGTEVLRSVDDFESLSNEYDTANKTHRQKIRDAADMAERKALRDAHPINDYWPRFAALADAGNGQAALWMVTKVKDKRMKRAETKAEKQRLYALLVKDHVSAPWFGDALDQMKRDGSLVGIETLVATYEAVIAKNESKDVKAQAMYLLAKHLMEDTTEERRAAGMRWFEKLAAEFEGTQYGDMATAELFEVKHLGVGCEAPDFDASTIDGHDFKLSDYRGKVVLLDFYGFW
tara:strand:+ start:485 stop:1249 length:765 start_codon:yes stop_codon:yes gene_type:complete